jgi:hypothetical protein
MAEHANLKTIDELRSTWWSPIWEFFIHVVVGTLLFALIGTPAIGLNYLVSWLEKLGVDKFILWGLMGCEYLLFSVDLVLFAVFIVRQAWRGLLKLWQL